MKGKRDGDVVVVVHVAAARRAGRRAGGRRGCGQREKVGGRVAREREVWDGWDVWWSVGMDGMGVEALAAPTGKRVSGCLGVSGCVQGSQGVRV